jgi:hypothetical protein
MGLKFAFIAVEGEVLKLQWWTNDHCINETIEDFNAHRDTFFPLLAKIVAIGVKFDELHDHKVTTEDFDYIKTIWR